MKISLLCIPKKILSAGQVLTAFAAVLSIGVARADVAAHRPTTMAPTAMVTTPHYLASEAALNVMRQGGNAVDAAITAASTIAVVYPHHNSIGGDNFWLIYNAKAKELKVINASGRSGEKATLGFYAKHGLTARDAIPNRGYLAVNTVPGAVSGWGAAYEYSHRALGSHSTWADLLKPAIGYAAQGFAVTPGQAKWTAVDVEQMRQEVEKNPEIARDYAEFVRIFAPDGKPLPVGTLLKQPDLAATLKRIAEHGWQEFYTGETAKRIVADVQKHGGMLTLNDFRTHKVRWDSPISTEYRGYTAYNLPPNSQGIASLEILNILNNVDVKALGEGSADYYATMVEATKQAFADRDKYVTDPDFSTAPVDYLLSRKHGLDLAKRIDSTQASGDIQPLDPKGDTVWMGFVDKDGNAVALIQSMYFEYGSWIVPRGTGVTMQNRGSFFSLDPSNINHLEPRKRTFSTLNEGMLFKQGKLSLVYGTQGGEGQPQTQTALVTRMIDFGMTPQEAIGAPRWFYGRNWGARNNDLKLESRIPKAIAEELTRRGYSVKYLEDYTDNMGTAGAILIDHVTHVRYGGADPRGEGAAVGY